MVRKKYYHSTVIAGDVGPKARRLQQEPEDRAGDDDRLHDDSTSDIWRERWISALLS
jgi:hypothetical protein